MPEGGSKTEPSEPFLPAHAGIDGGAHAVGENPANPELLRALGRLARGLSVMFWGLPVALVVCVQSSRNDWFRLLGIVPPLAVSALLFYGLSLLGHFQKQERPWRAALERARVVALINLGLSPFLYWWSRVPSHPFLNVCVEILMLSGLLFLILLNPVLFRLTAMLPDETLRLETRMFTAFNRYILTAIFVLLAGYFLALHIDAGLPDKAIGTLLTLVPLPRQASAVLYLLDHNRDWLVLFLVLLPLAMTMALIWKIKEVILVSVFGSN